MDAIIVGKPTWIGHYTKVNLTRDILGVSSTGYVIRIRCSDQEYALKRTYTTTEEPPDLAGLKHPHVVDLKHYWTESSDEEELRPGVDKESVSSRYLFLVMELMDGDLAQLMAEAKRAAVPPFSLRVAVNMMLQIAKGVHHLHYVVSIPHPQLKCANVLYKIVNKSDGAFQVGDVVVKLGGFGCSRPAGTDAEKQDVLCFGRICQELLTGDVSKSSIPETTPEILREFILCCLEGEILFSQIVNWLAKFGDSLQDVSMLPSETIHTKIAHIEPEDSSVKSLSSFVSDNRNQEIFTVHQLHPVGVSTSVRATLVFFHGFHKVPEEWRRSWMTRDNKIVWPQTWLPEDLGAGNIRVLSVSFDANLSGNYNRFETGKDLIRRLVLSPRLKLGEINEKIFLVGHSFGGVIIKSLVTEVRRFVNEEIRNIINLEEAMTCRTFLKSLTTIVFYSVPHDCQDFENYIVECKNIFGVPRSSFLQSLWRDTQLISDMNRLSEEFESVVSVHNMKVLAFLEGKPMSKNRVLFTQKLCELRSWEWHKIDKDNHFEVCRPDSKSHIGYKELKDHLQFHLNATVVAEDSERSIEDEKIFNVNMSFSLDNALISAAGPSRIDKLFLENILAIEVPAIDDDGIVCSLGAVPYTKEDAKIRGDLRTMIEGGYHIGDSSACDFHSQSLDYLKRNGPFLMEDPFNMEKNCSMLLNIADNIKILTPPNDPLSWDVSNMSLWKASLRELIMEMETVEQNFSPLIRDHMNVYVLTKSPYDAFLRALAAEIADAGEIKLERALSRRRARAWNYQYLSKISHPPFVFLDSVQPEPLISWSKYNQLLLELEYNQKVVAPSAQLPYSS